MKIPWAAELKTLSPTPQVRFSLVDCGFCGPLRLRRCRSLEHRASVGAWGCKACSGASLELKAYIQPLVAMVEDDT